MPTEEIGGGADTAEVTAPVSVDPHSAHRGRATYAKDIFCASCQAVQPHQLSVDQNSEILATCDCGRALFFPLTETPEEFDQLLARHHAANAGQVSAETAQAKRDEADARFRKLMGISDG